MSTAEPNANNNNTTPARNNEIDLNKLECEIKLVNNWKSLQLRSRFAFSMIDPTEIKAMMINYYDIYCKLETKLEFDGLHETFIDIPNINDMICFLNEININNDNNLFLLSIQIELPLIVLPIIGENEKYIFYGFANGKLLLFHNHSEINRIECINKNKICYKDILSIFNLKQENYSFEHPKNNHFQLNIYEEINIFELNELSLSSLFALEIIKLPEIHRCVICLSSILYETDEFCKIDCCSHIYHFECIQNLIKYSNDNQCPLCREKIKYVQYLYNNTINKIFKIKDNTLSIISYKHYYNKYYFDIKKKYNKTNININNDEDGDNQYDEEYDEKEGSIIKIPEKPCLGYLESMPSPTNSNSSISIPPTRHSSPSLSQLQLNANYNQQRNININNNNNNNNNMNHNNMNNNNYNNNNNHNHNDNDNDNNNNNNNDDDDNNNNNNNNNNNDNTKFAYFPTTNHDKTAGEDD